MRATVKIIFAAAVTVWAMSIGGSALGKRVSCDDVEATSWVEVPAEVGVVISSDAADKWCGFSLSFRTVAADTALGRLTNAWFEARDKGGATIVEAMAVDFGGLLVDALYEPWSAAPKDLDPVRLDKIISMIKGLDPRAVADCAFTAITERRQVEQFVQGLDCGVANDAEAFMITAQSESLSVSIWLPLG